MFREYALKVLELGVEGLGLLRFSIWFYFGVIRLYMLFVRGVEEFQLMAPSGYHEGFGLFNLESQVFITFYI